MRSGTVQALNASSLYRFTFELHPDTIYGDLPPHQRGELHLRAAQGLLLRRVSGAEVSASELAHHYLSAQPRGDPEVAIEYAQMAVEESLQLGAPRDALALLCSRALRTRFATG